MRALKIMAEGLTTSFRYPHFNQGVHITFEMPPPATIYGHVCSAVGDYIDPRHLRFAYHFQFDAKFIDYEHLHFFGKEAKMNPFNREQLFHPRLTLYVDDISLEAAFRSPRFAVALGRAQDLMTYTRVEVIELEPAARAFYHGTLLSLADAAQVGGRFYAVTMPRYIDPQRQTDWGQYAVLPNTDKPMIYPAEDEFVVGRASFDIVVDPTEPHPYMPDLARGVVWHTWQ
jgi:CRISPR-associated protein Cas5t